VSDTWAMVMSSRAPVTSYLALLDQLRAETSYSLWHNVIQALKKVDQLERGQPGRAAFQAYVCTLLGPLFERVGWDAESDAELVWQFTKEHWDQLQAQGSDSLWSNLWPKIGNCRTVSFTLNRCHLTAFLAHTPDRYRAGVFGPTAARAAQGFHLPSWDSPFLWKPSLPDL
jgi:hypothetical protein